MDLIAALALFSLVWATSELIRPYGPRPTKPIDEMRWRSLEDRSRE